MPDQPPNPVFGFYHRIARRRDDTSDAIRQQADRIADLAESYGLRSLDLGGHPGEPYPPTKPKRAK